MGLSISIICLVLFTGPISHAERKRYSFIELEISNIAAKAVEITAKNRYQIGFHDPFGKLAVTFISMSVPTTVCITFLQSK